MMIFLLDLNMSDSLGLSMVVRKGGAVVGMEGGTLHTGQIGCNKSAHFKPNVLSSVLNLD